MPSQFDRQQSQQPATQIIPSQLDRQSNQRPTTQAMPPQFDRQQTQQQSYHTQVQVQTQIISRLDVSLEVQSVAPAPPVSSTYAPPSQSFVPPPPTSSTYVRPAQSFALPPRASSQIQLAPDQSMAPPPPASSQRPGSLFMSQYDRHMASQQVHINSMPPPQRAEQEQWESTQLNSNAGSAACNQGKPWYRCTEEIAETEGVVTSVRGGVILSQMSYWLKEGAD